MILGLGPLVVNLTAPWLYDTVFTHEKVTDFHNLFLMASGLSLVAALVLGLGFHPPKEISVNVDVKH
jgi:hypothetical protein